MVQVGRAFSPGPELAPLVTHEPGSFCFEQKTLRGKQPDCIYTGSHRERERPGV